MRKVLVFVACAWCATAFAALLTQEVVQGLKKVCIYSDGSTITISSVGICPLSK